MASDRLPRSSHAQDTLVYMGRRPSGRGKRSASERGKSARKLGAVAEDMVSLFASEVDLVPTKSQRDWEGWDLASDIPVSATDPWGLPTPPIICRFQIKATTTTGRTVRLGRENVLRMVQQPIPWFLMLVRYVNDAAHKIDVVHIGQDVVEEVLRWAVLEPRATRYQLACDRRGVEAEPNARAWFAAIEQQIGEKATYVARKAAWNENAGRTSPRFHFSVEAMNTTDEEMVRFFLGLSPTMNVDRARLSEERFGVSRLRQTFGASTMDIPSPAPSALVLLTARSAGYLASVECRYFSTRPWLPTTPSRHRLKMKCFDMIIAEATSISLRFPEVFDLHAAAEEVRFFQVLDTAEDLMMTAGEQRASLAPFKLTWTPEEAALLQAVLTTHQILTTLGLRTSGFRREKLLHGEGLAYARAILGDPEAKVLSLTFKEGEHETLPGVILSHFAVNDDRHTTGFVVRFDGIPKVDEGLVFEVSVMKSIDRFAFPINTGSGKLSALLKAHADKIESDEGLVVHYTVDE